MWALVVVDWRGWTMMRYATILVRGRDSSLISDLLVERRDCTLNWGSGSLVLVKELWLCGGEKGIGDGLMMVAEWQLKEKDGNIGSGCLDGQCCSVDGGHSREKRIYYIKLIYI
jgi:hypothetical protein